MQASVATDMKKEQPERLNDKAEDFFNDCLMSRDELSPVKKDGLKVGDFDPVAFSEEPSSLDFDPLKKD